MIKHVKKSLLLLTVVCQAQAYGEALPFDALAFENSDFNNSDFDLPEFNEFSVPVVLTATRIQQHQSDVPASVTIISAQMIKQLGVNNLAQLLRFVPGIMVAPDKNNNVDSLNYHGGESSLPKNLQVLVNGRSMYRAGLASVSWYEMPVAMEDISRIEVVRGPNSASYGANAYQAVINILTKHPADTYGTAMTFAGGDYGEEHIFLRQGGRLAEADYRVSYTQKRHEGFDNYQDSRRSQFLDVEANKQMGGAGELDVSFIVADASKQLDNGIDTYQKNNNRIDENRVEIGARWTKDLSSKHQIQVKAYSTLFEQTQYIQVENVPVAYLDNDLMALYKLNHDAANAIAEGDDPTPFVSGIPEQTALALAVISRYPGATGIEPVAGDIYADLNEFRIDVEAQDTYIYSPTLSFVSGASFRRDVVDSDHYFDGELYSNTLRVFGSTTWQSSENFKWHLGFMVEKEEFADQVFAPRAALNYKLTPSQSVRFVYSESVRSPDFFEQFAQWTFDVENPVSSATLNGNTFYQAGIGPGELDHQKIISTEIGYYGRFQQADLELDVRLFNEQESKVLYQSLTVDDFVADSNNSIDHYGIEWQVQSQPLADTTLRMTGAYVDIDTSREDNGAKLRVYAKETGTLSWLQNWGTGLSSALNYFIVKDLDDLNINDGGTRMERLDGRIGQAVSLPSFDAELFARFQHDLSNDPYLWDELDYEKETRLVFGVSIKI